MTWDFQDRNWQVGRREDVTAGGGASKVGSGRNLHQQVGTGRQGDGKRNFTTGDGTPKVGTGR